MNLKVMGYILAALGLGILVFAAGSFDVPFLDAGNKMYVNILGMVVVAGGVVLIIVDGGGFGGGKGRNKYYEGKRKSKRKGKIADLPIYEGDNIIAYRRD